jgi:ketosteroid isomerase-like protein
MHLFLVALALLAQTVTVPPAKQQSLPPIQNDRFVRDVHDKNVADVLALYTPRAVFIDREGHSYKGADELRKLYEQVASTYDSDLHLEMTSLKRTYDVVIEHGKYIETRRNLATGAMQDIRGTYVFLHERQADGEWLIAHQRWMQAPLH